MAPFMKIPTEIILEILTYLLDREPTLPVVGQDAAWIFPPHSRLIWGQKSSLVKRIKGFMSFTPYGEGNASKLDGEEQGTRLYRRAHCTLKALRATNRSLNEICTPFLYRDLNLLSDLKLKNLNAMREIFVPVKWLLVQSLSVNVDPANAFATSAQIIDQATNIAHILAECRNLATLAIYYHHGTAQMMLIESALYSLFLRGRLSSLGFYSRRLLQDYSGRDQVNGTVSDLVGLINSIALYEPAQRSLRVLDVVADWIPTSTFDLIRSKFKSLTSLTLRRVVRSPWYVNRIWDANEQPKWHSYPNLTCLQLSHFEPGHAAHIPPLVQHFVALQELRVSACGNDHGFVPRPRLPGWSRLPEALCNNHRTLTLFHMEHMDDWEIYELGVIPTATLIVTTVKRHHFLVNFREDAEIFPGLRVLRLAPWTNNCDGSVELVGDMENSDEVEGRPSMQAICSARDIEMRRDAVAYWTCMCNSEEGY